MRSIFLTWTVTPAASVVEVIIEFFNLPIDSSDLIAHGGQRHSMLNLLMFVGSWSTGL
jgi:hypothetical protein